VPKDDVGQEDKEMTKSDTAVDNLMVALDSTHSMTFKLNCPTVCVAEESTNVCY
jgi:hypothetical protein